MTLAAHVLALLAAPVAALGGTLLLAKVAGRLMRWRSADGGSEFMFSMPIGGIGWQFVSALERAIAAFGAARLVFWILSTPPTLYMAAALIALFLWWDVGRLLLATRPPMSPPAQAVQVLRLEILAGFVASLAGGILFVLG